MKKTEKEILENIYNQFGEDSGNAIIDYVNMRFEKSIEFVFKKIEMEFARKKELENLENKISKNYQTKTVWCGPKRNW